MASVMEELPVSAPARQVAVEPVTLVSAVLSVPARRYQESGFAADSAGVKERMFPAAPLRLILQVVLHCYERLRSCRMMMVKH